MKHAYWGFRCKTPGCPDFNIVKYIGPHDGRPIYTLPEIMPGWCDWGCMGCCNIHRYMRPEMESVLLDEPPPPEFEPWF
jgi:hypothetical protein